MAKESEDVYLTVEETAKRLKVTPVTIYRMARAGKLPAVKVGKAWRISRNKLNDLFDTKK